MRKGQITTEILKVTPKMAETWLAGNTHNRKLRDPHVEMLKGAIERGEWQLNGDAIRFDRFGKLLDGQHRLWAVALAEIPVETVVIRGLPEESQLTMDRAKARSLADHLRLAKVPDPAVVAAMVNAKWKLDNGKIRSSIIPTHAQAFGVLEDHPELPESRKLVQQWRRRFKTANSSLGALHYEFACRDDEAAEEFFASVVEGVNLDRHSPQYALRRQVELTKLGTVALLAVTIKAWNAYMEGREVTTLHWRAVGKNAEKFPEIVG